MYISMINLNTYSLKHFNLFVNYVHASKFVSSLGINLDFFFIQHSAISQFILTILVFVIMVWALMRSFKISCWLHENFQWVTRTIHTLHLLVKDIISASSHRHKQGLGKSKGSLQETTPKCALKWRNWVHYPSSFWNKMG